MLESLSMAFVAKLVAAFLLGSVPFAKLSMLGTGVDITKFGSGNPGFNNVMRYSKWRSVICLIGDAGKGALAIWLLTAAGEPAMAQWAYGLAAVAGHCFSPWLGFNGGKGIATAAGVMLLLYPKALLPCVCSYIVLRIVGSKLEWPERGTIASLSSSVLFVVLLAVTEGHFSAALGLVLLLFVAWRHKKNFQVLADAAQSRG
ncbi:MAG: glycerol-3-phosphate acyltransferase [Bryobacteraceae bacterium]